MAEQVWICINGKNAKVWGYDVYVNTTDNEVSVVWYYGSIGRTMQQLTKRERIFSTMARARITIEARIKDKEYNGYKRTGNEAFFKLVEDYQTDLKFALVQEVSGG